MTWTPIATWVNNEVQIGPESTSALGTPVSAGKKLGCSDWVFQIESDANFYTPTGHKYPTAQEQNTEWMSGTHWWHF